MFSHGHITWIFMLPLVTSTITVYILFTPWPRWHVGYHHCLDRTNPQPLVLILQSKLMLLFIYPTLNKWLQWLQSCKRVVCILWWIAFMSKPLIYGREMCNKEWDLNWEHPFPRVLRYKRRNNIKEVDTMECRVYYMIKLSSCLQTIHT